MLFENDSGYVETFYFSVDRKRAPTYALDANDGTCHSAARTDIIAVAKPPDFISGFDIIPTMMKCFKIFSIQVGSTHRVALILF